MQWTRWPKLKEITRLGNLLNRNLNNFRKFYDTL